MLGVKPALPLTDRSIDDRRPEQGKKKNLRMIGIRHGFNLSAYLHICPPVALLKKEKEKKKGRCSQSMVLKDWS